MSAHARIYCVCIAHYTCIQIGLEFCRIAMLILSTRSRVGLGVGNGWWSVRWNSTIAWQIQASNFSQLSYHSASGEASMLLYLGVTGGRVVKDFGSWPRVMGSSPTSGRTLCFPFPGVYSALPQNEEVFGDVKPSVPGDLVHISLRPFQALISYLNGGKPKGATKKIIIIIIIITRYNLNFMAE